MADSSDQAWCPLPLAHMVKGSRVHAATVTMIFALLFEQEFSSQLKAIYHAK